MDIFKKRISVYNGVTDTAGTVATLGAFLYSTKHKEEILYLRTVEDKKQRNELKRRLPQATISGVFAPTRAAENLQAHNGLICIDIDRADNEEIDNFDDLKPQLCKLKEVAYIGISVSGNGYFVIIPLAYPKKHKQQFRQLEKDFARYGIKIDHACSDVCRMRCMTFDDVPYINTDAKPYTGIYTEPKPIRKIDWKNVCGDTDTVYNLCREISARGIDLTVGYDEWMRIGASLASMGENGRDAYHICSRQNAGYSEHETDKKFDNLLRTTRRIGLGTFIKVCKDAGININNRI